MPGVKTPLWTVCRLCVIMTLAEHRAENLQTEPCANKETKMSDKTGGVVIFLAGAICIILLGSFFYFLDMDATLIIGVLSSCVICGFIGYIAGLRQGKRDMLKTRQ